MRHGRTSLNEGSSPKIRAWKDVPLDPAGKIDIQMAANRLKRYKPGYVVSSDLMRDTETAQIVAKYLGMDAEQDFNARTWDVGSFEGEPLKDVNPAIESLYRSPWETPPGSSESFNGFSARWIKFLDEKMELAANVDKFRPAVIVTHGKNIALAYSYINGINPWEGIMPLPAGFSVISIEQDRSLSIAMKGETENVIEDV